MIKLNKEKETIMNNSYQKVPFITTSYGPAKVEGGGKILSINQFGDISLKE